MYVCVGVWVCLGECGCRLDVCVGGGKGGWGFWVGIGVGVCVYMYVYVIY